MVSGRVISHGGVLGTFVLVLLVGCTSPGSGSGSGSGGGSGGGGSNPTPANLTGNWQFQVTTSGSTPFNGLSGFVNEQVGSAGDSSFTTASVKVLQSSCFSASQILDLSGFTKDPYSELVAFPSYSQTVTLDLSSTCSAGTNLCGGYKVSGGCGDGQTGQMVGVQYAALTGTYSTAASATPSVRAMLTQVAQGNGQGTTQMTGTLTFSGASCLTSATLDPARSYVSGSSFHFVATTNAASGAVLTADASFLPTALGLTLGHMTLGSDTCLDSLNGAQLSKTT